MSGFDLDKAPSVIEREDTGRVVELKDEAGRIMDGVTVTVAGTYSKRYRRAMEQRADRRFRDQRRTVDPEAIRQEALEVVADCVLGWSGFVASGVPLDCSRPNVVKVFTVAPWIHEQVAAAMDDHASFSVASSGN